MLSQMVVDGMNEQMETDEEYVAHVNALVLATNEKVEAISSEQKHNNEKLYQTWKKKLKMRYQ